VACLWPEPSATQRTFTRASAAFYEYEFFTHPLVSTFDRVSFQLIDEYALRWE
jgi:hypothetical protein